MTQKEIVELLSQVEHPAISYSLIKLGIVTDISLSGEKVRLVFAFPFPNIPIGETLINSIAQPLQTHGLELDYEIRIMTEIERQRFLQLESEAWKG